MRSGSWLRDLIALHSEREPTEKVWASDRNASGMPPIRGLTGNWEDAPTCGTKTCWRIYKFHVARERLGFLPEDPGTVAGGRDRWMSGWIVQWKDGWIMDGMLHS